MKIRSSNAISEHKIPSKVESSSVAVSNLDEKMANADIIPLEDTEKKTIANCLISTIIHSATSDTRYIPFKYKDQIEDDWKNLRAEIKSEIDDNVKLKI